MINASLPAGHLKNDTVFQVIQALFSPPHPNSTTHHRISHTHQRHTRTIRWNGLVLLITLCCGVFLAIFFHDFSCFCWLMILWFLLLVFVSLYVLCQASNLNNKMKHRCRHPCRPSLSITSGCTCIRTFNSCNKRKKSSFSYNLYKLSNNFELWFR